MPTGYPMEKVLKGPIPKIRWRWSWRFRGVDVATDPKTPDVFESCVELELGQDLDADGLNDCEEAMLGTEPSLVDTDGDGMPDGIEMKLAGLPQSRFRR